MWEYILGAAAVVMLIMVVDAWLNSRIARGETSRLIAEELRAVGELIRRMAERDERGVLSGISEKHRGIHEILKELERLIHG